MGERNGYTGLGPSHAHRRQPDDPGVGPDDPGFGGPDDPGQRLDHPAMLEQLREGRMSGTWSGRPGVAG